MATVTTTAAHHRFPQARRLLAIISTIGLTLGSTSLTYAQDIPTPTPPADGGEFEGGPEPTPGVDITPEPTVIETEIIEPAVDAPPATDPLPNNNTAPELPAESIDPAGESLPDASLEETPNSPTVTESPATIAPALPTDETGQTPETTGNNPAGGEPSGADTPQPDPAAGSTAPANNSPRGLW